LTSKGAKLRSLPADRTACARPCKTRSMPSCSTSFTRLNGRRERGKGTYDKETPHFLSYVHRSSVICGLVPLMTGYPEIGRATPVRGLIGGKEAIDHEAEVAPTNKACHDQVCPAPA